MIHRDVKLENLLLADKRDLTSVHLVDFGLARAEWRPFDSILEQARPPLPVPPLPRFPAPPAAATCAAGNPF